MAVICCQRRRGRKQLEHIRRAACHTSRASSAVGTAPLNAANSLNAFSSEDTQLLRASTINKLDANSTGQRMGDITAFPQNYHPARSSAVVEDPPKQPFLSIPNHVPTYAAPPVVAKRSVEQPTGRREKVVTVLPDDAMDKSLSSSESGSILRRRQGSGCASSVQSSSRLPLIKVMSAPEGGDVWEEQDEVVNVSDRPTVYSDRQRPVQKKGNVDTSTVTWSYEPSSKPISYSPTPAHMRQYDTMGSEGAAGAVEMVTFNTVKPPTAATMQRSIKPQGILKSSSSLPCSGEQREQRSQSCVIVPPDVGASYLAGKKTSVPAPPPQVPSTANAVKPPPPSYSQALARLGRQKAVEFVDELPKRHDAAQQQQQSSLPPLLLSAPGTVITDDPDGVGATGDDRSPSPWHRLKPSVV